MDWNNKKMVKFYWIWGDMVSRCTNVNHKSYVNYGHRGIKVCDSWLESFENFYNDMYPKPKNSNLDRIDNNKGYSKENCRWASRLENNNNKRIYKNNKFKISGIELRENGKFRVRVRFKSKIIGDKTLDDFFEACCFVKSLKNKVYLELKGAK